jgi:hypothetical protein
VALAGVPFFPQQAYQCGPAALATVLWHSGVAASPDALRDAVYLPGRQGSLQPELLAAARRQGRIPYRIPGTAAALLAELAAGHPVLVLQNRGLDAWPRWHYAVVAGYEADGHRWLLRSGRRRHHRESHDMFWLRWAKADHWAIVIPPPGDLPATVSADQALQALADAEPVLPVSLARVNWEAALARWPGDHRIQFATANTRRAAGEPVAAAALYRQLLASEPGHLAARNNYADLLLASGCPAAAWRVLESIEPDPPTHGKPPPSPMQPTLDITRREVQSALAAGTASARCTLPH